MDAKTPLEDQPGDGQPARQSELDQGLRSGPGGSRSDAEGERNSESPDRDDEPSISMWQRARKHPWLLIGGAVILVLVLVGLLLWWLHARQYESTDDAFIDTRTVTISPQIAGSISQVLVTDNQLVKAGAPLVTIDDATSRAQVAQAAAQVDQAIANIANLNAQLDAQQTKIDQAQKQVEQARAASTFAQQEFNRAQELSKSGSGTVQQVQQTQSNRQQAEAQLAGAQANAETAVKQLAVLRAQRRAADAQLEGARAQQAISQTNLSYNKITAPTDGRVTNLTAAVGAYVAPGQALMMFVPRKIWVTANFKETQLALMRSGQPVEISIDAYPAHTFHGHIDSIQAGSGTAFSLLPPENATGNYVKVVQRVPVKIVFDEVPDLVLGPGMSVVPTVKVR